MLAALFGVLTVQAGETQPAPIPAPTFSITLGGRTACVTPSHSGQARADGGAIDVVAGSGTLSATLTGTVAANAHLGCTGSACETFHLVQEFEITCSDPNVKTVSLTLDSYARRLRAKPPQGRRPDEDRHGGRCPGQLG